MVTEQKQHTNEGVSQNKKANFSVTGLFISTIVPIFSVEFGIMFILKNINHSFSVTFEMFLDSLLLVLVLYPILYIYFFRSLLRQISERKIAEEKLKEQIEFSHSLIMNTNIPTFVLDHQHKVIIWNKACEALTGLKSTDIIGTDEHWKAYYAYKRPCISDLVIDGRLEDLSNLYEVQAKSELISEGLHGEGWISKLRGENRYLILDSAPIRSNEGELIAVIETLQDFTERKLAEQSLAESEESHRQMVENAPLGIVVCDIKGYIKTANPLMLKILGSPSLEATQSVNTLNFPPMVESGISRSIRKCIETGETVVAEHLYTTKWGKKFYMRLHLTPLKDDAGKITGAQALVEDFTECKKVEEALKYSEEKYHSLYTSMNEGVGIHEVVYDEEGRVVDYIILDVNPSFERIIGLPKTEVAGKKATEVYSTIEAPFLDIYSQVAIAGEPAVFETVFSPLQKYFKISSFSPGYGKFASVFEDITERKQMENKLQEQNNRIQKELKLACSIQTDLLPIDLPQIPGASVAAAAAAAKEVGGDYCDLIVTKKEKLAIAIGDVMGKGVGAALFMAMTYAYIRNYAFELDSPSILVNKLNSDLYKLLDSNAQFITLFFGVYEPLTKELKYTNAGHNPPLIYRAVTGECENTNVRDYFIGGRRVANYRESSLILEQGDIVLFYTDGIKEGMNNEQEQFGMQRIESLIKENHMHDSASILDTISASFLNFLQGEPLYDDVTMIVLKIDAQLSNKHMKLMEFGQNN